MCDQGCETCPPKGYICVPRGDSLLVIVPVRDGQCNGALVDISGVSEIVFAVADEVGGVVRILKRMSDGEINVSTNDYEFYFSITSADSSALVRQTNYFEMRVTSAGGEEKTVLTGILKSPETIIKDIM